MRQLRLTGAPNV